MAQHVEPMDVESDFDDKENSLHHNNVLPFTEKGYEELDVSELNMKLRYSITPVSSPMSKSYTANCLDNRNLETGDDSLNITVNEITNLTRSLNSTITTKNDNVLKSMKALPLQTIQTDQLDNNRQSILRPLESTTQDNGNLNVTIISPCDVNENLSLPSSTSSALQTPEATTPTKDDASPIMRGLKSVFNMFRSSQSPIPPADNENSVKPSILSLDESAVATQEISSEPVLASTPISAHRKKEMSPTKRSTPIRDCSITFNDDLEKELQWKDETTIIFSQERIPIHRLLFQQPLNKNSIKGVSELSQQENQTLNITTDYMDVSPNDSIRDSAVTDTLTDSKKGDSTLAGESDSEFVDCETTFTKNDLTGNQDLESAKDIQNEDEIGSRLRKIVLNTTQDILDATLSIRPEDLLPGTLNESNNMLAPVLNNTVIAKSHERIVENLTGDITHETVVENLLNDSRTTEVTSAIDPNEQTFTAINSKGNIEVPVDFMNLNGARSDPRSIIENIDTVVTSQTVILDNKTLDMQVTPMGDNLTENTSNTDKELNKCPSKDLKFIEQSVLPSTISLEELTDTISKDFAINIIKEPILHELPIDIPLPEEDDSEKYSVVQNNTSISESFEIIDDTKRSGDIGNTIITVPIREVENIKDLNEDDKVVLQDNSACISNATNVNSQTLPNTIIELKDPIEQIETQENLDVDVCPAPTEQVSLDQESKPMSTSQNFGPFPDIVNRTNIVTNTEVLENVSQSIKFKTENLETTQPSNEMVTVKDDNPENIIKPTTKPIFTTEDFNNESQINHGMSENGKPVAETSSFENVLHTVLTAPEVVVEKLPCDDSTNYVTHIKTSERIGDIESGCRVTESLPHVEKLSLGTDHAKDIDTKEVNEELMVSKTNRCFGSVAVDNMPENLDVALEHPNVIDPLTEKDKVVIQPPDSPPIRSKGYNFNFDDIDFDPFATKTNIRLSPPEDLLGKVDSFKTKENMEKPKLKKDFNRYKTQSQKRKSIASKRKLDSTFDGASNEKTEKPLDNFATVPVASIQLDVPATNTLSPKNVIIEETDNILQKTMIEPSKVLVAEEKLKQLIESPTENSYSNETNINDSKATSSSEQSTYFSAGTSSSDSSIPSKNVFNLPEINDKNFNPFATKCKMRQSPPPSLDIDNTFMTSKIEIGGSPSTLMMVSEQNLENTAFFKDKIETELMEKDVSGNLSDSTNSSKSTDGKNATTREIHTEDEDTIEGPFLDADDVNVTDKLSEFASDNIDMIQFKELPAKNVEESPYTDEMFIDAEAFEFLLNQNKSNTVVDSGKESLFLKFDPLFAKRMSSITSDSVVASLAKLQKRQSTPTKEGQSQNMASSTGGPSNANMNQGIDMNTRENLNDDFNITMSKPMMVVPPAVNPITPRNKSLTPNRSTRRSFTFTSPAMAVIDRLLSLSGNNSETHDTIVTQISREQNEADIALSQLRELLAEKEISVYNLRSESNELSDRLNTLESHVKTLEAASQDKLNKINQLNETLAEKTKINKSMAAVVEEYERTIARLIAETAQDKKKHAEERIKLINERDEQTAHLASMEVSFSDLHSKYEKSKQVILHCKANEDAYKKSIKDFEENLSKMQNNYELLKQHATSKLNHANQELEKMNKSHEAEVLKLNAMIKRKDLHITSLEESLAQKTKANEELTAICDELINKVG